jgi:hypothetical protein
MAGHSRNANAVRLFLPILLIAMSSCSSGPPCPPGFERSTHPPVSLCYPVTWKKYPIQKRSAERTASWLELFLAVPGGGMFSVDILPVSQTDFPLTMIDREDAIDRYAYANGIVSRLKSTWSIDLDSGAVTEEVLNGQWRVRNRIFHGSSGGPSTYDFGKIYETRIPITVTLTTGLAGDRVVLFTQSVPAAISEASQRTLIAFAKVRETVTLARTR